MKEKKKVCLLHRMDTTCVESQLRQIVDRISVRVLKFVIPAFGWDDLSFRRTEEHVPLVNRLRVSFALPFWKHDLDLGFHADRLPRSPLQAAGSVGNSRVV